MNLIRNQVPDPFSHTPPYKLGEPMRAPIKREQLARAQQVLAASPYINGAGCWNRTNTSRLSIAGSTFELILPGAPFGS